MRLIDDNHRHVTNCLIIVYPRIKERINKRDDNEEDEHSFIPEHLLYLLSPDIQGVFQLLIYFMVCRHNSALHSLFSSQQTKAAG